ncbi:hypothetical protein [cf. Phormidesmis sp. LEGE 11477]|uniref:hypothetical protein n=1 Tax=cf. Phormidesmis sp. LEGE 11477 TaxID=1828680 RepID=UPI001882B0B6|nr:hypothetical protein [cf. Phormidesmis sp. LEGE 11477]MBE9061778.1 hypothetical protein [cf. Phormidesmis sp. LEGE 11477]
MKLPIASLNKVKLQSLKPFQAIAEKLSSSKARLAGTHQLTRAQTEESAKAGSTKEGQSAKGHSKEKNAYQIALTLLLVRPWVLVLGFWIFSMGIGTLALGGMLSPRRLTRALPEPTTNTPVASSNRSADTLNSDSAALAEAGDAAAVENTGSTDTNAANGSQLPLALPLVLLVSACAVGCFVISRRRAMKMAAARARVRKGSGSLKISTATSSASPSRAGAGKTNRNKAEGRVGITAASVRPVRKASIRTLTKAIPTVKTAAKAAKTSAKKPASISFPKFSNLSATSPSQRRSRSKTGRAARAAVRSAGKNNQVLASRATAVRSSARSQQAHSQQARTLLRKNTIRAASRRQQPMVSVVPASESHTLDWREASLAHQMDVRPHRSAM